MKHRPLCMLCVMLVLFIIVYCEWSGGANGTDQGAPPGIRQELTDGQRVTLVGQVYKSEQTAEHQILYLSNYSIAQQKQSAQSFQKSKLMIYDKTMKKVKIGNTVQVTGTLYFFSCARNPGNFDQRAYYGRQDIHGKVQGETVVIRDTAVWQVRSWLADIRQEWKEMLLALGGEQDGGILSAMLLGDKADMEPHIKELYQKSGIAHVLAISGLHLSFIGTGVYQFLRRRSGSFLIGGVAGMSFLLLYMLMIGPGVSSVRAVVMLGIRIGADVSGRVYDMPTSLGVAAAVVLLWRPLSIYDGGFWLSFGAVLGIVAIYPVLAGKREEANRKKETIRSSLCVSISVQLVSYPVLLYQYFEVPVYAVLLNLLVIPLMSVLLLAGFACLLSSLLAAWPCLFFLWICRGILSIYEFLCSLTMQLPGARIITGQPRLWQIGLYYGILVLVLVWLKQRSRGSGSDRCMALGILGIACLLLASAVRLERGRELEVTMLDVGQGDGIFIGAPGGIHIFLDGGSSDVSGAGRYRIEPFLKARGVGTLDYVCISHGDADHINGIEEMLKRQELGVKIDCLVLPSQQVWEEKLYALARTAKKHGTKVAVLEAGDRLPAGALKVTCLQPGADYEGEPGNGASMVLDVKLGAFDMLCTGDVEREGEQELTERILQSKKREYEVLKVAHHGSKHSTSEEFLDAVHPAVSLISAGAANRYGHPHGETIERLKESGCAYYNTAQQGAISIYTDGSRMEILSFLKE